MKPRRTPRLADMVAARLRDDILSRRISEGDSLPRQEELLTQFRVSLAAVREALRTLELEGLISVRRGNVGGAVVHLPTSQRIARMISMALQVRDTTLGDVSAALMHLEPACAALCATRADRAHTVVPILREAIEAQNDAFEDSSRIIATARQFHEALVNGCGNETMIVLIGSLETIWSAHESIAWAEASLTLIDDESSPLARRARRAAIRDHERLLAAIEAGDDARAFRLASTHLAATRASSPNLTGQARVNINALDDQDMGLGGERGSAPLAYGS